MRLFEKRRLPSAHREQQISPKISHLEPHEELSWWAEAIPCGVFERARLSERHEWGNTDSSSHQYDCQLNRQRLHSSQRRWPLKGYRNHGHNHYLRWTPGSNFWNWRQHWDDYRAHFKRHGPERIQLFVKPSIFCNCQVSHFSHILLPALRYPSLSRRTLQTANDDFEHGLEGCEEKPHARAAPDGLPWGQFQIRREVWAFYGRLNYRRRKEASSKAPSQH